MLQVSSTQTNKTRIMSSSPVARDEPTKGESLQTPKKRSPRRRHESVGLKQDILKYVQPLKEKEEPVSKIDFALPHCYLKTTQLRFKEFNIDIEEDKITFLRCSGDSNKLKVCQTKKTSQK